MADDPEPPSRRTAIAAMLAIVVLVLGGLWLAHVMHASGQMEDCLMSGRHNCAPIHGAP